MVSTNTFSESEASPFFIVRVLVGTEPGRESKPLRLHLTRVRRLCSIATKLSISWRSREAGSMAPFRSEGSDPGKRMVQLLDQAKDPELVGPGV